MLAAALDAMPDGPQDHEPHRAETPEDDRPRGPDGKFVAKEPSEEPAPAAAAAAPETPAVAAEPAEEPAWSKPPPSWKKDFHEAYAKAPPEVQQYVTQREEEMRRGIEPLIPKAKMADEFMTAMAPFEGNIRASGLPPAQAVATLMQADNILRNAPMEQRVAYARDLLGQYGIDLSGIDWSAAPVDPRMVAMQNELRATQNTVTILQQQSVEAHNAALLSEIEELSRGKEHFEAVRPAMAQLLQSCIATSFEDAYEKAIRLDDTLSQSVFAAKQAQADADKRKAADEAAKAAKAAAVSVRSSTPGRAAPTKAQDRRSLLAEAFDGLDGRI
jgi:hypothetical protein